MYLLLFFTDLVKHYLLTFLKQFTLTLDVNSNTEHGYCVKIIDVSLAFIV